MTPIEAPKAADILCGKDKTFGKHPGNMLYRDLIESKALDYANAVYKLDKMKLTTEIVDTMVSDYGSRFLRPIGPQHSISNVDGSLWCVYGWEEISLTAARDKTSHALRFCAAHSISTRSSAMKDKMDPSPSPTATMSTEEVKLSPTLTEQVRSEEDRPTKDFSGIDQIIQQKLKQIEREKEQQMLLRMNNADDSSEKLGMVRKFKKLPIAKASSNSKKPKVARSPRKPKGLSPTASREEAMEPPTEVPQKHFFTLSPQQYELPPIPPPVQFFSNSSSPLFPRTVSNDMIVLATAAAAVEAAEARAAAARGNPVVASHGEC